MAIKKFGVVGAGQMGNGIVQVAAASGLSVLMSDIKEEFIARGLATIAKNLGRSVEKQKITSAERDAILAQNHRPPPIWPIWRALTLWWRRRLKKKT